MNLKKAEELCMRRMLEHGVFQNGFVFQWENNKNSCGYCRANEDIRILGLSKPIVKAVHQNLVEEIILHEIAHALDYIQHDRWRYKYVKINGKRKRRGVFHDEIWKDIARSIGLEYPTTTIAVCME